MTKILVLGSNSFSGSSYIAYLMKNGFDVFAASRSERPHPVMLPYCWNIPTGSVRFQKLDINHDLDALEKLIRAERLSTIVNFGAQSMVGESWNEPEDWMTTNVVSASKLAERLRHIDFIEKYVHVTTPEVYGSTDGWITEDTPFNPSTPYAVSRAAGDLIFKIYRESFNLPVVLTRAANVYGPGQQLYRIIPRAIFFMLTGKKLPLQGGGLSTRSFIHMDDVSNATAMIAKDGVVGETYHISTNRVVSIKELVEIICSMLGKPFEDTVEIAPDRVGKDSAYWLNSEKLRKALSWRDKIGLEEGLQQCVGWVRDNLETLTLQPQNYIHKA